MVLQGDRILLMPYTIERCHEFYKEYVADPTMTDEPYTYNKDEVDRYFCNKALDKSRIFFAICYGNKVIGEIQIKHIDVEKLCGTLSIHLINDKYKGKGYGTEAQQLAINYAINIVGLNTIYADTIHKNYRSKHILEKLGFEHVYDDNEFSYYKFNANSSSFAS